MFLMSSNGHRVTTHDRCGRKRSSQPWHGDEMKTYDYGLHELFKKLDLHNVMMIHSFTGGGEAAKFFGSSWNQSGLRSYAGFCSATLLVMTDKCPNEASPLVPSSHGRRPCSILH